MSKDWVVYSIKYPNGVSISEVARKIGKRKGVVSKLYNKSRHTTNDGWIVKT